MLWTCTVLSAPVLHSYRYPLAQLSEYPWRKYRVPQRGPPAWLLRESACAFPAAANGQTTGRFFLWALVCSCRRQIPRALELAAFIHPNRPLPLACFTRLAPIRHRHHSSSFSLLYFRLRLHHYFHSCTASFLRRIVWPHLEYFLQNAPAVGTRLRRAAWKRPRKCCDPTRRLGLFVHRSRPDRWRRLVQLFVALLDNPSPDLVDF